MINLTHEDFPETLHQWHLANQRMAERIARDELELKESEQPPIPKYVPEKKIKVDPLKVMYMFLP